MRSNIFVQDRGFVELKCTNSKILEARLSIGDSTFIAFKLLEALRKRWLGDTISMLHLGLAYTIIFEIGSTGLAQGISRNQVWENLIDAFLYLFYYDNILILCLDCWFYLYFIKDHMFW